MRTVGSPLSFVDAVAAAPPYSPTWARVDRRRFLALDRNESTRPLPPLVAEAVKAHLDGPGVHVYPDGDRLLDPLARYCGVPARRVLPTNGSNHAIQLVLRSLLPPGGSVLMATPGFPFYGHTAAVIGGTVRGVPFGDDLTFPHAAFADAAARTRPAVIVVVNPNNPTGSAVAVEFVDRLAAAHPDVPVVVDEAYVEYTGTTCVPLVERRSNVIVLRSFSKAFAMAGLRLGYVVADEAVVAQLGKLRNPADVNALAVVAGEAQLRQPDEMRRHVHETMHVAKPLLTGFLARHGVRHWPGAANFTVIDPGRAGAVEHLRACGILVCPTAAAPIAGCIRVTVGTPGETRLFCDAFGGFLAGAPARRLLEVAG